MYNIDGSRYKFILYALIQRRNHCYLYYFHSNIILNYAILIRFLQFYLVPEPKDKCSKPLSCEYSLHHSLHDPPHQLVASQPHSTALQFILGPYKQGVGETP